jgi:hypothetical protein
MIDSNIPGVRIEACDDGTIVLEQDWSGNVERVAVHAIHIRYMAEKLGIVREVSASEAELLRAERDRAADLRKENDRLKRNMLRIQQHALAMQDDFRKNADWKHADLTHEMGTINTLVDLLDMAVDDFADDYTAYPPAAAGNEGKACFGRTPSRLVTPADPSPKPCAEASAQMEIEA